MSKALALIRFFFSARRRVEPTVRLDRRVLISSTYSADGTSQNNIPTTLFIMTTPAYSGLVITTGTVLPTGGSTLVEDHRALPYG